MFTKTIAIALALCLGGCVADPTRREEQQVYSFPDGFLFGAATASYQVEGAWDEDDKGESIWDHLTHTDPCAILDCSSGDVAADSYHQVERDVEMMRELGLDFYRFSLSWPRILPDAFSNRVNQAGVDYYNRLIDEMLKYNIQPMVTIYHWDLPQKLQDLGGWANPEITTWFTDFARVVFDNFADRVHYWITFNEPREVCYQGYGDTTKAPRLNMSGYADYHCGKNLLVAHAKTYRMYESDYKEKYGGEISMAFSAQWSEPESEEHADAAEDNLQFDLGLYAHPIFSESGDFPQLMKDRVAAKSQEQGFARSRLPEFTAEEIDLIRGSADYFGLNHYTTYIVYRNESVSGHYAIPSFNDDIGAVRYQDPEWTYGATSWNAIVPWGFGKLLHKIKNEYNNPPIIITENGFSTPPNGPIDDTNRILYYREYLRVLSESIAEGVDVRGYTAWSMMDNFEWMWGYTCRFGLYDVDMDSPSRTRTPRKSAYVYRHLTHTRTLDLSYEPDMSESFSVA